MHYSQASHTSKPEYSLLEVNRFATYDWVETSKKLPELFKLVGLTVPRLVGEDTIDGKHEGGSKRHAIFERGHDVTNTAKAVRTYDHRCHQDFEVVADSDGKFEC